ncbi:MAG: hypothetical protein ACJ79H_04410 [Myxococcales bacterium]
MSGGPLDLYALCREWLDVCELAVASTPGGAIARSFVSPGMPAWDCPPQLTVHAGGPAEADTLPLQPPLAPGMRPSTAGSVHIINMTATVLRCSPTVKQAGKSFKLPSPAALEATARECDADVWALWAWTRRAYQAGFLFPSEDRRRELFFDPAVPVRTAGGASGWEIQIRVALGGYRLTDEELAALEAALA